MEKILRVSDKGNPPRNPIGVTREICIKNFVSVFGTDIIVIADNCGDKTISFLENLHILDIRRTSLGNSGSLKYAFEICYNEFLYEDKVYLCEGDFLHLPNSEMVLVEGLERVDYATLYDHLDKYQCPSQNPFIKSGMESTKVFLTRSSHWKYTNSTVQTFATRVGTLVEDKDILYKYNFKSNTPQSFATFTDLWGKGRTLACAIPGMSSPCDSFMSPLIDWASIIKNVR